MSTRNDIIGAVPATKVPRYAGKGTFARIADIHEVSDYDIAILGVPFDGGTSYRPGARFGPMAVRQAARALGPGYHVELGVAPVQELQVVDAGDVAVTPYNIEEACQQIQDHAAEILRGGDRRIVSIGGDHTIALPNLRALHAKHGPVALVHFDAHLDTWDTYFNAPVTWTSSVSTRPSMSCGAVLRTCRCICPSTSTCSTRHSRRAPARRRRAVSRRASC